MSIILNITSEEYILKRVSTFPHCSVDGQLMRPIELRKELRHWWEYWECECGQQMVIKSTAGNAFKSPLEAVQDFIQWAREDWLRLLSIIGSLIALILSVAALIFL